MVKLAEGIKRPFTDLKKLVIGIIVMWIPIVNIIGYGYALKCAETRFKKKGKSGYVLPKWEKWGDMFIKGLVALVISIVFFIPAFVVFLLGIGTSFLASANVADLLSGGPNLALFSSLFTGASIVYMIIFIILFLAAAFLLPLALMNYVKKWKFGDAFEFKAITKKVTSSYFGIWILSIIYGAIVGGLLAFIPLIGGAVASFIVMVTTYGTWYPEAYMGK